MNPMAGCAQPPPGPPQCGMVLWAAPGLGQREDNTRMQGCSHFINSWRLDGILEGGAWTESCPISNFVGN